MKVLTAQQKAAEVGISLRALAKTRHLYKYIQKSSRKFLYFEEDERLAHRPNTVASSDRSVKARSRRRNVPFGNTNYSKAPSGSGEHFKLLNRMRAKMALEASIPKEEQEAFTNALAHKVKENYKEINEQRKAQTRAELMANDRRTMKMDPARYGGLYNPKNVAPRYSIQFARDAEEDRSNEDRNFLDTIPGAPKRYY
uniref:Uncharacterized protein n=1 Tax=uncultured Alphaproteobacteria bacterium TaxID=91750 RepID=A0A1B0Z2E6_9PROT|nr:hypothetical protein [uncultured Alphaproteobacteria bacterium]ANO58379.1 hypothetical protein [uncultured Alphaproteobacteria bacterium]